MWITPHIKLLLVYNLFIPNMSKILNLHAVSLLYVSSADNVDLNHAPPNWVTFCILPFQELFVEDIGVEPMTLCVQGRCSSQLS